MKRSSEIRTNSRFKVWLLTTFCGKKVRAVYYEPRLELLGIVLYNTTWALVSAKEAATSSLASAA